MKSWRVFLMFVALGVALSSALTACGKKNNDDNDAVSYGSVSSDGNVVTSRNTSIQGIPLDLQIRNITVNGYGTQVSQQWGQQQGTTTIYYDLSLNGMN